MTPNDKFHNHPLASDFVVNFYLDNRGLLLDASMSRTQHSMEHRKLLLRRLTDECRDVYGVNSDQGKIKYHFDNRKARVLKRGHDMNQKLNQTGLIMDASSEISKNETDRRLWQCLSDTQKDEYPFSHRFQHAIKEASANSDFLTEEKERGGNLLESLLRSSTRHSYESRQVKDEAKWDSKLILPNSISDHVIEYFLENQNSLLENTNSRSNINILERKQKMSQLTADILYRFGIVIDAHKLKSHFDNRKSRVMRKGFDYVEMVRRGSTAKSAEDMFHCDLDFKLWRHFQDSQPKERENCSSGAELLSREIKVEIPEIIKGNALNLDSILRQEKEQSSTRKRKYDYGERLQCIAGQFTEKEFRAKQFELIEKQIEFFNRNTELITTMTSAVSLLFANMASLNIPK